MFTDHLNLIEFITQAVAQIVKRDEVVGSANGHVSNQTDFVVSFIAGVDDLYLVPRHWLHNPSVKSKAGRRREPRRTPAYFLLTDSVVIDRAARVAQAVVRTDVVVRSAVAVPRDRAAAGTSLLDQNSIVDHVTPSSDPLCFGVGDHPTVRH